MATHLSRSRRLPAAVLCALALLGGAACGGGDDGNADADRGTTTTTAPSAGPGAAVGFEEEPGDTTTTASTLPIPESGKGFDGYVLLTTCPPNDPRPCQRPSEPVAATVTFTRVEDKQTVTAQPDGSGYYNIALGQGVYKIETNVTGAVADCPVLEETVFDTYTRVDVLCAKRG